MIENFGWLIKGQLAGSGGLIHHEELIWLREQGIGAIVSLTERSLRREKLLLHRRSRLGAKQLLGIAQVRQHVGELVGADEPPVASTRELPVGLDVAGRPTVRKVVLHGGRGVCCRAVHLDADRIEDRVREQEEGGSGEHSR